MAAFFPKLLLTSALVLVASVSTLASPTAPTPTSQPPGNNTCIINTVCFVIDMSSSINSTDFKQEIGAVIKISRTIAERSENTKYSAVGFASRTYPIQSPTADLEGMFIPSVKAATKAFGGTNMYEGLNACYAPLKGMKGSRVIVMLTDGEDTESPTGLSLAPIVKDNGIKIVTVGVGPSVDEDYLMKMATTPAFYVRTKFETVVNDAIKITDSACEAASTPDTSVVTPNPTPSSSPVPSTPVREACENAYDACDFKFRGKSSVPTVSVRVPDEPLTPRIVSRTAGEYLGTLNMNNIVPEFIAADGSAKPITKFARPSFTPTHFKPYAIVNVPYASGIGHQTFHGNQQKIAVGKCVRVFFSHYQTLTATKPRYVLSNVNARKADNKCVVFRLA